MDPLELSPGHRLVAAELSWRFSRSSGPGGQSVNTADSRVEVSLDLTRCTGLSEAQRTRALDALAGRCVNGVLTVTASEHRAQLANREAALRRLVALVRQAVAEPPPPRRATRPSRSAVARRLAGKRRRAVLKQRRARPSPSDGEGGPG